jgi:hypothetical protein
MSVIRGDCPFCGAVNVPIDDEHVFAQRIIRLIIRQRRPNAKFTMRSSRGSKKREFTTRFPELVVHGPCQKVCNNRWMRELEERVAPYLDPMIATGQVTLLDNIKAPILALWSVVRTMVYEFHDVPPGPRYFTDADRLAARRGGFPTGHHIDVWTARYLGPRPFYVSPMPINISTSSGQVAAHYTTFSAGQFVFQVLARPAFLPFADVQRRPGPWHRLLKVIPNSSPEPFVWPPIGTLDDDDVNLFAWSFLTGTVSPRRGTAKIIGEEI